MYTTAPSREQQPDASAVGLADERHAMTAAKERTANRNARRVVSLSVNARWVVAGLGSGLETGG